MQRLAHAHARPAARRTRTSSTSTSRAARRARPETELAGCKNGTDPADPTNSLFQLDVIKVPLDNPEQAEVVTGARIFTGLDGRRRVQAALRAGGPAPAAARRPRRLDRPRRRPPTPTGPRNCHDVTAYPAMNLLAGACATLRPRSSTSRTPRSRSASTRSPTRTFSRWHTAVFSNDGKKLVSTDEWGGGTSPMCQASSMMELGGNTMLTLDAKKKHKQRAYFKIPSAQTAEENCVSHNGGIIPVPGRDIMVQGWYQGGVNIMDFTDPDKPFEIGVLRSRPDRSAAAASTCPAHRRRTPARSRRRQHDRRLVGRVLLERPDLSRRSSIAASTSSS